MKITHTPTGNYITRKTAFKDKTKYVIRAQGLNIGRQNVKTPKNMIGKKIRIKIEEIKE